MKVTVEVARYHSGGLLTLEDARDAALFHVDDLVTVNGDTTAKVVMVDQLTGVVRVDSDEVVRDVVVESVWHPDVIRALGDVTSPGEERISYAACRAIENGQRFRRVACSPSVFTYMCRRLGPRIEHNEQTDETWIDMMTAAGPVRVFASPKVQHDAISLDVDERAVLFSSTRDRQTREQLERRAELEMEDAETRMREVELTKIEIARRAS